MSCVFCDIVAGRSPASIVYEDDHTIAFMDLIPMTRGHTLVIPKDHYRNLFDTPSEVAARLMAVGTRLASALCRATGCKGLNAYIANEAAAGQVVWHLHMHLLPRYTDDGFGIRFPQGYGQQAPRSALDRMATLIKEALANPI